MWVYRVAPFFVFKGIVYDVVHTRLEYIMWDGSVQSRKIKCLNEVALRTPKWANDDSKFVKFLSIHILLTSVCGLSLHYIIFLVQSMTVSILVNKLDNRFVVHLPEPAMKQCFTGDLCSLGVQYR